MTDTPELASLTIKDLRQLAGEHNIQNRSRLGKEELIQALQEAIASQGAASSPSAADQRAAEATASAASGGSSRREPVARDDEDDDADAEAPAAAADLGAADAEDDDADVGDPVPRSLPLPTGAEPEEITAESVAMLAGRGQRQRQPQQASAQRAPALQPGERQPGDDQSGDAGANDDDGGDFQPAGEMPGEGGGEGGRRRRRRRGRGRGRRDDEFSDQQHGAGTPNGGSAPNAGGAPNGAGQPQRSGRRESEYEAFQAYLAEGRRLRGEPPLETAPPSDAPAGDAAAAQAAPDQADAPAPTAPRPQQVPRPQQQPVQQRAPQAAPNQQRQGPPRPRVDGPQRPMPSVLDRLCTFSRGILELCNPDTPSWAQPRLSELLAEAGMTMIPAQGQPHAEYHEVVGTMATRQVPPGHIAEMVAPGFALRGDRGDLFPLKKARVRVAEGGAPVPPPRRDDDAPRDDHPRETQPRDEAPSAPASDEPEVVTVPEPDASPEPERVEPEQRADAPRRHEDAPRREDGHRSEQRAHPGHGRQPQGGRSGDGGRAAPQVAREPAPAPAAGRPPLRTHAREPAGDAPTLPLASQVPDELAARAKAEGFRALGLNDQILADLAAMGYTAPTPIQEEAIPVVLSGKDMIGQAQTGTGKTAAFVLPMLQRLYAIEGEGPVALVLCPTRELARQVHGEFVKMAGASGARAALIYGGVPMDDQVRALERKPHVVVGTPGRIIDHMRRKVLSLSRLSIAVLDEADQMLDIGFWPDVNYIISHTPPGRQMLLFSATFPDPVKQLAEKHMKDPTHVRIAPKQVTVEQVDQKYFAVPRERKTELLAKFIETQNPEQLVVFCRTKHQTDRVAEVLKRKHMSAAAIHGDLPQSKREKTLAAFRARELQCLIATNVAARGLDIPSVSHVVNYDIPEMPEEYVHRIGRTARNGARGVARTFITPEDGQFLVEIEKHIGLLLEEEKVEGFTEAPAQVAKRTIAAMPAGQTRILKPLVGGIRLGRRR